MLSMIIWVVALAAAIAGVSLAAAFESPVGHMSATAFVTFGILAGAVKEHRDGVEAGLSPYTLAGLASRYMGLMWAWSGISAYVVYAFILEWSGWQPAVIAMFVGCATHLFVGHILDREALATKSDPRALGLLGFMIKLMFAMAATLLGLLLTYRNSPALSPDQGDAWVAINLALCTAVGLLSLCGYLILQGDGQARSAASRS